MMRAKAAIKAIVGTDPRFVRATYGYTDGNCMKVYARNKLKHVYWDIVSGDDAKIVSAGSVRACLETATKRLATGSVDLIYLLHDINQVTAEHLPEFIDVITASVRASGHRPVLVADGVQAEFIMDRKARQGTDTPCPADSMG